MNFRRFTFLAILSLLFAGTLFVAPDVFAQTGVVEGLDDVGEQTGLGNQDIRITIGRIINVFLSVLGIIAVLIVMYGGFVWMTAGGDPERVNRAKKILINGLIGLVIIFLSWAITAFVFNALVNATGAGSGAGAVGGGGGGGGGLGGSGSTSFVIADVRPQGEVPIRNILVQAIFSRNIDVDSVTENSFEVVHIDSQIPVAGTLAVSGNKITFAPEAACPDPNGDRKCFESNTAYEIRIHVDIESTVGTNLTECSPICRFGFTSGEIVDVDAPDVTFELPDNNDNVPTSSLVDVQVSATDDYQVAVADFTVEDALFDSVIASGDDLSDVLISTLWDTASPVETVAGSRYTLRVTVVDLAGNTASDTVSVKAVPAYCFNGQLDADEVPPEEGVDCGGLCGACEGTVCSDDSDCAGSCVDGLCVSQPVITDVQPRDGAPGTFVTISGSGFRSVEGTIEFAAEGGGTVEAFIPACADGWSDSEIVVEVPQGAGDGAILLTTSAGLQDATNDDAGPIIEDFDVNDVVRPNLCKLSPRMGGAGSFMDAIGNGFGSEEDTITFTSEGGVQTDVRTYTSWAPTNVRATVPALGDGAYDVTASVGGVSSNALRFNVRTSMGDAPTIGAIAPGEGGEGQYVTITGSNFGASLGIVWFENSADGTAVIGDTSFPNACGSEFWQNDQVIVKVPDAVSGAYNVYVERSSDASESNRVDFFITDAAPLPGVCAITPSSGTAGDEVTLIGENFGAGQGSVTFYNEANASVINWGSGSVEGTVPASATTGPVRVTSASGDASNTVNFELTAGDGADVVATAGAAYVWRFSTGQIPIAPRLAMLCSEDDVSAVPNSDFSQNVCVNAVVFAYFDTEMDESTLNTNTILVERCDNENCSSTTPVDGTIVASTSAQATSFVFTPSNIDNRWQISSTYRVTVTPGAQSISGTPLANAVSWDFTTSDSIEDCDIDRVIVNPKDETLTTVNETTEFNALPTFEDCQVLNGDDFTWSWSADPGITSISEGCGNQVGDSCVTVEALAEGVTDVVAQSDDSGVSSSAILTINFTDPFIDNRWPDCATACVNAQVGGSFNISMDPATLEIPGAVRLYECTNEFCNDLHIISDTASCIDEGNGCTAFSIGLTGNLDTNKYHRVVVSGSVSSLSGVSLTRLNYGADYSWTFLTRDDPNVCTVARIDLEPENATLSYVGEMQQYLATPFGEPDSCSVAGQRLDGFDYAWDWTDPIDATSTTDDDIASWVLIGGGLIDVNKNDIPNGCTASCLAQGSQPIAAVCGNGIVEYGEDCDDGNTFSGDGCSNRCLNEGIIGGTCGNGVLDAGEECDDGNTINGDGCSDRCLNEGAQAAGLTCGDGIVSHDPSIGGEECDDGNTIGGDGCSATCLREGSVSISNVTAICGNGIIEQPYETCDDGNTVNGDGCSDRCLREGSSASVTTGFVCGNGIVERTASGAGEDCDGEIGCGANCLWQGSSLGHATPSVCGDGIVGPGELAICELGTAGDGNLDPYQIAVIDDDAAAYVGDAGIASQTIEVGLDLLSATSNISLLCTAESDLDCPAGFGADANGCCTEYPTLGAFPNAPNACLNAAVYVLSNMEMNASTFAGNAYLRYDGGGACPASHSAFSVAHSDGSFFARAWAQLRHFFARVANAQQTGECLVPVDSFRQVRLAERRYKISFVTGVLLEPNAPYTIVVKGGVDGVKAASGVGLSSDVQQSFSTGEAICSLDVVEVEDQTGATPGLFSRFDDAHGMVATPYTQAGGVRAEIQPVAGVYDWNWLPWQEDSGGAIFSVTVPNSNAPDEAVVTPQGVNGEATLVAQAEVIEGGSQTGSIVAGTLDLFALLCENPWPNASVFPFEDSQDGFDRGLTALSSQPAWMNFSTYYCRDTGDQSDLLPRLSVVSASDSGAAAVIKEYFFAVGSTEDVIGIRIASNPKYLSPLAWYEDQGFEGNPSETTVDGFEAVRDGRTTYVAAPNENVDGRQLYSNIYVISYNANASEETVEIFNQILDNWSFAINVNDVNLCFSGGAYTATTCSADRDCNMDAGEFCAAEKDKLMRDTKRLADLSTISNTIGAFGEGNKLCSATTSQSCSTNTDCPSGESCVASYPTLPAGTFVRAMDASPWSSWTATLGAEVGGLPQDPLNVYSACGDGTANPDHDALTCVNNANGIYICPVDSYAYHYRSQGPFQFAVSAELEYQSRSNSSWVNPIDPNMVDGILVRAGNARPGSGAGFSSAPIVCDGSIFGDSNTCGDGVVGGAEVCEIGQLGPGVACDANGDGVNDGVRATVCNNSCTGFTGSADAQCVPFMCGNGIREPGEVCDDGSLNGSYGFCNSTCSGSGAYCGDGRLAGGEACDCGSTVIHGVTVGGGACSVRNGVYSANPNNTCAWDCGGPAGYCGDGIVQSGEQCDGTSDVWAGRLCSTGGRVGAQCTTNADCGGGLCGPTGQTRRWASECPASTVCLAGTNNGAMCTSDADCPGSQCSTFSVQTVRTRTCADDGAAGDLCTWTEPTWRNIACKATGTCGDGVVDPGEECDDGNSDNSDSCTNLCTINVCGDGFLHAGVEQCDSGDQNGIACNAAYGSVCTYCSATCTVLSSSGAFCGDGVRNGGEFCDAGDRQYYWMENGQMTGSCKNPGAISGNAICSNVGVCNGGSFTVAVGGGVTILNNNGKTCFNSTECGTGGTCQFPVCSSSCASTCPFTYESNAVQFLDNQVGATRSGSVNLLSVSETEDATVLGNPTAATAYVPACRVAKDFYIDIDSSARDYPDVEVMFILDRSQSMASTVSGNDGSQATASDPVRLDVLREAVGDAIETLFDEYAGTGGEMRIGLAGLAGSHFTDPNNRVTPANKVVISPTADRVLVQETAEFLLEDVDPIIGTPIYESIRDARESFTSDPNIHKVIVVFSDGSIYNSAAEYADYEPFLVTPFDTDNGNGILETAEYMQEVSDLVDRYKNNDIEIFTGVLTESSCDIDQMARWSSMSCVASSKGCASQPMKFEGDYNCSVPENGVQYSYKADTANELRDMYEAIVDSILDVTITASIGSQQKSITVPSGSSRRIELPTGFRCDEFDEAEVSIRASFIDKGTGSVMISNGRINMCSP